MLVNEQNVCRLSLFKNTIIVFYSIVSFCFLSKKCTFPICTRAKIHEFLNFSKKNYFVIKNALNRFSAHDKPSGAKRTNPTCPP